ncbi:hypothetical protein H2199_003725 [Coniosporium tulheliwenetii]|uniref:Uncharacterized protein n=1 Tax=Coniosporium tulheliwenetii TaxID=3383036 RepID=A0ACC2ZAP3_9PEZI|nr:hypothetical protein H2199_003725 [Cladosporium sp. JES 115]
MSSTTFKIRPALSSDLLLIPLIEYQAGQVFRTVGMDAIADDPPPTIDSLVHYASAGRIWVAVSHIDPGTPIAYLTADLLARDGLAHVAQVTVSPEHARKGIGASLLRHLELWARDMRLRGVSLTTFSDVPWNRPMYERLGYETLEDEELQQEGLGGLRGLVEEEGRNEVLKRWPRCTMIKMFMG